MPKAGCNGRLVQRLAGHRLALTWSACVSKFNREFEFLGSLAVLPDSDLISRELKMASSLGVNHSFGRV